MATDTVIGNYRLEEVIGRGGMGVVYRGHHTKLPREVAIKSIDAGDSRDLRRMRHRFEREAYVQSQLDHPGIVKVYDYIVAEQTYYIVMEYVEGRSLAQVLAREESPLPVQRALKIFEQILAAIACAHTFAYRDQDGATRRGLIHRDLKPANILIAPDDRVKITDFGIVKLVGSENTDTFGTAYGSPQYVSPEQAQGKPVDQRSDIYSLGVILYEMLTGAPPFGSENEQLARTEILRAHIERPPRPPSEINPEIPPEVEAIILRALEKERDKRFNSSADFLREVRHARGKDTGELPECDDVPPAQHRVGTEEVYFSPNSRTIEDTARQSYITQPIRAHICSSCGSMAAPEDSACPKCGHELGASPATAQLARHESVVEHKKNLIGFWTIIILSGLALIIAVFLYINRTGSHTNKPSLPSVNANQTPAPQTSMPTSVPESALVELKPARISVDSSFDGYSTAPLTDGVIDVREIARKRYNAGNWASAETPQEHWIELDFDKPERITAVYVYWGFDRDRFMPSRLVMLQAEVTPPGQNSSGWNTISTLEPGNDYDRTAFDFAPVTVKRLRILQPAKQGPANRPFVMWVREVKVYGIPDESGTP